MRILIISAIAVLCSACATNQDSSSTESQSAIQPASETLLQPMPMPGGPWTSYSREQGGVSQHMWTANEGADVVRSSTYQGASNSSVELAKSTDDQAGAQKCETFGSSNASPSEENGYPTITWISSCQLNDGSERHLLNKVISGKTALYHFARSWNARPSSEQLGIWKEYFATVQVCDPGAKAENACGLFGTGI
ncbi:hypothetical protein [Allohahella marinimesophila]|uniref:Uncharacterized protein n=1 Tax=Allohahella marinimesophila TaxID=1054972 RepID=A0ABP7NHI3_9GAMM